MQDIELYFADANRKITDINIPISSSIRQRLIDSEDKPLKSIEISRTAV